MIIKFQNMSGGFENLYESGHMTLECDRYRFHTEAYSTPEERIKILNTWSQAHVIFMENESTYLSRETPEIGIFRIYKDTYEQGFMDFACENTRVYVMNDEGKTVDKFRVS